MNLVIVRHGETVENAADIIMGQRGGTLSEKGIEQAKRAAAELKDNRFDQAWSSDLARCVDTAAQIMIYHPDIKLQLAPALREVNYGEFQGRPAAEIREFVKQKDFYTRKTPGGESQQDMAARAINFVDNLYGQFPNQTILLVTHTGPIEAIRAAIERTPFVKDAENASIWRVELKEALQSSPLYPIV